MVAKQGPPRDGEAGYMTVQLDGRGSGVPISRSPWGAQLEAIEVSHYIDPKTWTALYDAGLVSSDAMMFLD